MHARVALSSQSCLVPSPIPAHLQLHRHVGHGCLAEFLAHAHHQRDLQQGGRGGRRGSRARAARQEHAIKGGVREGVPMWLADRVQRCRHSPPYRHVHPNHPFLPDSLPHLFERVEDERLQLPVGHADLRLVSWWLEFGQLDGLGIFGGTVKRRVRGRGCTGGAVRRSEAGRWWW